MTSLLKTYIDKVITTPEGEAFLGYLLTDMGLFTPQTDPAKLAVQQYAIGLLGKLDLYSEHGRFQVNYVNALTKMPRTPSKTKVEEDV